MRVTKCVLIFQRRNKKGGGTGRAKATRSRWRTRIESVAKSFLGKPILQVLEGSDGTFYGRITKQ